MPQFQPPPTWAEIVIVDSSTKEGKFNPVWLKWFVDLIEFVNAIGGTSGVDHNTTANLQGGTANQYYHFTAAEHTLLQLLTGSSVIRGTAGAPGAGLGSNGDFYFRADGGVGTRIYFKTGGVWTGIL